MDPSFIPLGPWGTSTDVTFGLKLQTLSYLFLTPRFLVWLLLVTLKTVTGPQGAPGWGPPRGSGQGFAQRILSKYFIAHN